jgi:hypothetical protein
MMFDRTEVMALLERDCLGPIGGSASIVGALKVGKTKLLEHIASRPATDTIVCRVDPPSLRGFLAEDERLSDHTFLRFFVVQVLAHVDELEDRFGMQEDTWTSEMQKAEQRLMLGGLLQQDRSVLEDTRKALQHQLHDLKLLRDLKTEAEALVKDDALESSQLWRMFNTLKKLRKRVVLLIDDFHALLEERGFSDRLFNFLRGANNQGKIFAIVFSPSRPMDTETRPRDLFNHLKTQLLEPFNRKEAEEFLEWDGFNKPARPFSDDEKNYLYGLGGGSAHFLRGARERFVENNRPTTPVERSGFERKHLVKEFYDAFLEIWSRCSRSERTVLQSIVGGTTFDPGIAQELEWKGYVVRDSQNGLQPFSTLFREFIVQKPGESKEGATSLSPQSSATLLSPTSTTDQNSVGVQVEGVEIPYRVFPTALYAASPDSAEQVIFHLKNTSADPTMVQLSCSVASYFQETRKTVTLAPGSHEVALRLVFDKTKEVKEVVATQVAYRASLITGNTEPLLKADNTELIRLLPSNNFLMARYDAMRKELVNFTWLIAAWVTRESEELQRIRTRALELEPLVGHKVLPGPAAATDARIRVAAIYKALQEQQIVYNDDNIVFHAQENDYVQRVQLPVETLDARAGNCLDGSVMFASVLSICGMNPLILLIPGHALVGWRVPGQEEPSGDFCETTLMATADFDLAWEIATKKYEKWQHALRPNSADPEVIENPKEFAIIIDVHKVWQERKLLSVVSS